MGINNGQGLDDDQTIDLWSIQKRRALLARLKETKFGYVDVQTHRKTQRHTYTHTDTHTNTHTHMHAYTH